MICSLFSRTTRLIWIALCFILFTGASLAQSELTGVIDIHAHSGPDSSPRSIDAIDLARLAKQRGMRAIVLKNHYESTAALAYVVRQVVPGIEIFGGIDLNLTVGGLYPESIERMTMMKGGYGKVVWMPTFDNENQVRSNKENRPFISISKDGHLAPEVEKVIDVVAKHQLTLETGHSSAEDGLLIVREAHKRGVRHIVVTHAMASVVRMTIPQMQQAARDGAFIEFVYSSTIGPDHFVEISDYVRAIRAIGPAYCILSSDLGKPSDPVHPDGLILFFQALRKEGISQAEIDLMSKANPATALGLQ